MSSQWRLSSAAHADCCVHLCLLYIIHVRKSLDCFGAAVAFDFTKMIFLYFLRRPLRPLGSPFSLLIAEGTDVVPSFMVALEFWIHVWTQYACNLVRHHGLLLGESWTSPKLVAVCLASARPHVHTQSFSALFVPYGGQSIWFPRSWKHIDWQPVGNLVSFFFCQLITLYS